MEGEEWNMFLENTFAQVTDILGANAVNQLEFAEIDVGSEISNYASDEVVMKGEMDHNSALLDDSDMSEEQEGIKPDEFNSEMGEDLFPQQRSRCNTWPRRQLVSSLVDDTSQISPIRGGLPFVCEEETSDTEENRCEDDHNSNHSGGLGQPKMNARRNPWGNYSYADLITQAIQSSPDRRLTLSQVYDWMVAAIPYFRDRSDNITSAGWKNSIRHNLSLHQKFLKIQNEGTGKSSWWTLNPEKKVNIKPRRRATSGDTRALHNKREKVRRRLEANKNGGRLVQSSSSSMLSFDPPSSKFSSYDSVNSSSDVFRPRSKSNASSFDSTSNNIFSGFRPRTLSNASSVGGQPISPLQQVDSMDSEFDSLASINNGLSEDGQRRVDGADLDKICLDDLNLGGSSGCFGPDPAVIIRDYLHPSSTSP